MSVSLSLYQTRSIQESYYRVDNTITTSSGIPSEVFVKKESTYEFDRVASLQDIIELPTAPDSSLGYFRVSSMYKDFSDVAEADIFASGLKVDLNTLVSVYDAAVVGFIGSEEIVITPQ